MQLIKIKDLKLFMLITAITISFFIFFSFIVSSILNTNMKITSNIYYTQISNNLIKDINTLKSLNEYLIKKDEVLNYLKRDLSNVADSTVKKNLLLKEINKIKYFFKKMSFVDAINIVDIDNQTLISRGKEIEEFDIKIRPWFDNTIFESGSRETYITYNHRDYFTNKSAIAIITYIYDEKNKPIGVVILDIYLPELIEYIENSFDIGILEVSLISSRDEINKELYEKYNIYFNDDILGDKNILCFKFLKDSTINNKETLSFLNIMRIITFVISILLLIIFLMIIKYFFKNTIIATNRLKNTINKISNKKFNIDDKTEFEQLEILSETLNKTFDEKTKEFIFKDELTRTGNRKKLVHICNKLFEKDKNFAIIFFDINNFKYINDIFGHTLGDEYLKVFANSIINLMGDKGDLIRYSGDEFIFVYSEYTNNEDLIAFYRKNIIPFFSNQIEINKDFKTYINFSAGVAIFPKDATILEDLIYKSDLMMYENKKNRINMELKFFNDSYDNDLIYENMVKNELELISLKTDFEIRYKPIFNSNNSIIIIEAYIFWKNENFEKLTQDKFINILENSNRVAELGYWVIENICNDFIYLKDYNKNIKISINIFHRQLMDKYFIENLQKIINNYNLTFEFLYFEIKEMGFLELDDVILKNIEGIKALGIKIILDDYGIGHTSFNYLRNYKVDMLKINKRFLNSKFYSYNIIKILCNIANILGIKVIIDGIENDEQIKNIGRYNIKANLFQESNLKSPISKEHLTELL